MIDPALTKKATITRGSHVDASQRRYFSWLVRWGVIAGGLAGGNWAILTWIDILKTQRLQAEYFVPADVICKFQLRKIDLPVRNTTGLATYSYRFRPPPGAVKPHSVPLVVYLHSAAECGNDTVRQLLDLPSVMCEDRMSEVYPCALLAPQCPLPGGWSQPVGSKTDLIDVVLAMIDAVLADSRINPDRVYLIGLSMGGTGTWKMAMRSPDRFAAIVPICGEGDVEHITRLVDLPVWAVHGTKDDITPVSETQEMIAALETAGGKPHFLELSDSGHICWDGIFTPDSKVLNWMFQQERD